MTDLSECITAWSYSRLDDYESCPYKAFLKYVDKVPQPPLTVPEGKDEHPLERGTRLHSLAERYVCHVEDIELSEELRGFNDEFVELREIFQTAPERIAVEQDWAIDANWSPTGWFSKDAWGRIKLDCCVLDGSHMRVIDYKTGKKYPPKHTQQGQLYALAGILRFPEVETVKTEFWYLDNGEKLEREYSRLQVMIFKDDFERRALEMTTAKEFPPRPGPFACRFCPYSTSNQGNGFCEHSFPFD